MSFKECVVETYSEEIPARFQDAAKCQSNDPFLKKAKEFCLVVESSKSVVTPQRLVLKAHVAQVIPEEIIAKIGPKIGAPDVEKRGPKIGSPEKEIQDFCASVQVFPKDLIEKGEYYYAYTKDFEYKPKNPPLLLKLIEAVLQSFV